MDTDLNRRKQSQRRKMGATAENARGMQGLNRRFWDKQDKFP